MRILFIHSLCMCTWVMGGLSKDTVHLTMIQREAMAMALVSYLKVRFSLIVSLVTRGY